MQNLAAIVAVVARGGIRGHRLRFALAAGKAACARFAGREMSGGVRRHQ